MREEGSFQPGSLPVARRSRLVRRIPGPRLPFMPYGLVPMAGLGLLFALALVPVAFGHVQSTTERAARQALDAVGASWAAPSVSGQWVVLEGEPPTPAAAAMAVESVRNAHADTIFGPARPITRVTERFIWTARAAASPSGPSDRSGNPAVAGPSDACTGFLDVPEDATIEFETGSAIVSARSAVLLDRLERIAACTGGLRIEGHTDDVGGDAFNLDLSRRRANAVRTALIHRGADPEKLFADGHGAGRPIVANDTEEGRSRNRRIEIRAIPN